IERVKAANLHTTSPSNAPVFIAPTTRMFFVTDPQGFWLEFMDNGVKRDPNAPAAPAPPAAAQPDAISGNWAAAIDANGTAIAGELTLKLDGERVSGTLHTDHTGTGTFAAGSFKDGVLAFRAEFPQHPPIEMTARLQDGKLVGEFRVP